MPFFPSDDTCVDDPLWLFIEAKRTKQGLLLGARCLFPNADAEEPEDNYRIIAVTIRSAFNGGYYPDTYTALHNLMNAIDEEKPWGDKNPIMFHTIGNRIGDLTVGNFTSSHEGLCVPFFLEANNCAKYPRVSAGFDDVLDAMNREAPNALRAWSRFPKDLPLHQQAEEELRAICAEHPPQGKKPHNTFRAPAP